MTDRSEPSPTRQLDAHRLLALSLAGIAGLALAGLLALQLYARWHAGQVLPGVHLAGQALGGLSEAEASARLAGLPLLDGDLELRDPEDGRSWTIDSAELGLRADPALLAEQAMRVGRDPEAGPLQRLFEPLRVRRSGFDLATLIGFDADQARARLEALAPELNVAPRNARIERQDGRPLSVPSTTGRVLDVEGSLAALSDLAARPITDTLDLALGFTAARIFDVGNVAEAYALITSGPLDIYWREGQTYAISVDQLEAWASIEDLPGPEGDAVPSIIVDRDAIRAWVAPLAAEIDHPPADARYGIDPANGRLTVLDGGRAGTRLDLEGSVDRVIEAAYTEQRVAELAVELEPRRVSDQLERELNTRLEEVQHLSTSFAGSPTGRLQNLLVAVERLDGLTLAPGQEASFLAHLGEVSASGGFDLLQLMGGAPGASAALPGALAPAPTAAVEGGPAATAAAPGPTPGTAPAGLTGGIAQVATTFFRAAFWLGLPITERHAPPLRIGWLEPPIGLDATVFPGQRDLRFVNDTPDYLVFDLGIDVERGLLSCVVYGRPVEQRSVELIGPSVEAVTPAARPASLRQPLLALGLSQQVGWAREGARVRIERRVSVDGAVRPNDRFDSLYAPAGDLVIIGTGP